MKVLLHSTPAFFLFSQSSPLSGPAGCSNVKRRKLLYNTAVKTWTVASGANMWRRQIGGTPNWTPGPRIVDSGHVDIVIKHPQTHWAECREGNGYIGMQILMQIRPCVHLDII